MLASQQSSLCPACCSFKLNENSLFFEHQCAVIYYLISKLPLEQHQFSIGPYTSHMLTNTELKFIENIDSCKIKSPSHRKQQRTEHSVRLNNGVGMKWLSINIRLVHCRKNNWLLSVAAFWFHEEMRLLVTVTHRTILSKDGWSLPPLIFSYWQITNVPTFLKVLA